MVQQKFHYNYHKYEIHDEKNSRHDRFKVITDITSSHGKQDCKVQENFKYFILYGPKLRKDFVLTNQEYQFMNAIE